MPKKSDQKFRLESAEVAEERKWLIIRILRARGRVKYAALADKLAQCSLEQPCRSAACPACARTIRVRWTRNVAKLMTGRCFTFVTIIPRNMRFRVSELSEANLERIWSRVRKTLYRHFPDEAVFGAIDMEFREELDGEVYVQFHLHLNFSHTLNKEFKRKIKKCFAAEKTGMRRYDFKSVREGTEREIASYPTKQYFPLKRAYRIGNRTKYRPLPPPAKYTRRLIYFLDQYKVGQRLISKGFKRNGRRMMQVGRRIQMRKIGDPEPIWF